LSIQLNISVWISTANTVPPEEAAVLGPLNSKFFFSLDVKYSSAKKDYLEKVTSKWFLLFMTWRPTIPMAEPWTASQSLTRHPILLYFCLLYVFLKKNKENYFIYSNEILKYKYLEMVLSSRSKSFNGIHWKNWRYQSMRIYKEYLAEIGIILNIY
jgi:hypothetical protein